MKKMVFLSLYLKVEIQDVLLSCESPSEVSLDYSGRFLGFSDFALGQPCLAGYLPMRG